MPSLPFISTGEFRNKKCLHSQEYLDVQTKRISILRYRKRKYTISVLHCYREFTQNLGQPLKAYLHYAKGGGIVNV